MFLINFNEGKDKINSTTVRILGTTSFNIDLKDMFINCFDEENKAYQTVHFDDIDVFPNSKMIEVYNFLKENKNETT